MILLVSSINNVLNTIGLNVTGSVILLALLILVFFGILMFVSNIPSSFILIVFSLLIIGMNAIWGGAVLHILAILVALVLGTTVGLFIIKLFNKGV